MDEETQNNILPFNIRNSSQHVTVTALYGTAAPFEAGIQKGSRNHRLWGTQFRYKKTGQTCGSVVHVLKIKQAHVAVVVHNGRLPKQIKTYIIWVKITWLSATPRI
jgi:hypothetical protein